MLQRLVFPRIEALAKENRFDVYFNLCDGVRPGLPRGGRHRGDGEAQHALHGPEQPLLRPQPRRDAGSCGCAQHRFCVWAPHRICRGSGGQR